MIATTLPLVQPFLINPVLPVCTAVYKRSLRLLCPPGVRDLHRQLRHGNPHVAWEIVIALQQKQSRRKQMHTTGLVEHWIVPMLLLRRDDQGALWDVEAHAYLWFYKGGRSLLEIVYRAIRVGSHLAALTHWLYVRGHHAEFTRVQACRRGIGPPIYELDAASLTKFAKHALEYKWPLDRLVDIWPAVAAQGTDYRLGPNSLYRFAMASSIDGRQADKLFGDLLRAGAIDVFTEPHDFLLEWDVPSPQRYFVGLLEVNGIWPEFTDYARNKLGGSTYYSRR